MTRVWFNKSFSSIHTALSLIRRDDAEGRYTLVCSHTNPHAVALLMAHEAAVEPSGLSGQEYLGWCLAFCRERRIDIFVPGKEAGLIGAGGTEFASGGTRVLAAGEPPILQLIEDKARLYADAQGAAPPEFRVITDAQGFEQAFVELRARHAQLCVKPSVSVFGRGFRVIDEARTGMQRLMEGLSYPIGLAELRLAMGHVPGFRKMLLMEYLDGDEYSVDCVGDAGRLVCAVPRRKSQMAGYGQTIDPRRDLLDAVCALTRRYGLNGLFNIQFREGRHGLRMLEINPRISGGIGMACLAGPNLPYLALAGFDQGYGRVPVPELRTGLRVGEINQAVVLP